MAVIRPYHHGNLPAALTAAAREILDEGGTHAVGLRETARRVDVSATAAYRHFVNKEDLLASVATEGFRELGAAMEDAAKGGVELGANPLSRGGFAYVEFAARNRGLFRLMFGPSVLERRKYPALKSAIAAVSAFMLRHVEDRDRRPRERNAAALAAWGLVQGLADLIVDGFVSARGSHTRRAFPAHANDGQGDSRQDEATEGTVIRSRRSHQILRASSALHGREAPRREAQGPLAGPGVSCGK